MVTRPLGLGTFPDVAYHGGRWWCAWQHGAGLFLVSVEVATLRELTFASWDVGVPSVFPKLASVEGRLWLGHRDGREPYRILLREIGTSRVDTLDVGHGDHPIAFGAGDVAWQATGRPTYEVWRRPLDGTAPKRLVRMGAPTGLSRVLPDGSVKTLDDDNDAVPGYTRPCWAGDVLVAEGPRGGAYCRLTNGRELLAWPGEIAKTPRCAVSPDGRIAIVAWDGPGVRMAEPPRSAFHDPADDTPIVERDTVVDVLDYLPIGLALNGSHLYALRATGQSPNVVSIAKHPDGGGEWWAYDDRHVYHHFDQAGSPIEDVVSGRFTVRRDARGNRIDAYYFAPDARFMPRRVKTDDVLEVETRIHRIADGSSEPWRHRNSFEVFSSFPSPIGSGRAMRITYDPRRHRDPNGRLQGRYEKGIYVIANGRKYHRWEDWRTTDDNTGDELMQQTEFVQVDVMPAVTWRPSRRPTDASLLPQAQPQRSHMTISEPPVERFPVASTDGRVRCVCAPDGGGWAPWVEWIWRRQGEAWQQQGERRNPRDDADHTFQLPGAGTYEIGLRWDGGQTGRARAVRVEGVIVEPPPQPPPTPPPASKSSTITLGGWLVRCDPASGLLYADRQEAGQDEQFEIHPRGDQFATWAVNRQQYVRAIGGGNGLLVADRARDDVDERFTIATNPETGARGIQVRLGGFWCAEGGGGREVVCDRRAIEAWESAQISGMPGVVPGGNVLGYLPPAGQMRMEGWAMADDRGPRSMLSVTLFDAITQFVRDRARLDRNIAYGLSHGVDFFRVLGEVDWPGAEFIPRAVDRCVEFLRYALDQGTRIELTIYGSHSHIDDREALVYTEAVARAIRDVGLEMALALVEIINEPGGARWSVDRMRRHAEIVRRYLPTVPLALGAPYQDGANTTTGWHENEDGARAYLRFSEAPANIVTPHFDRGTNGVEGQYRICRQPYIAAILGRPFGNNEGAGPGASAQDHDVMRDPTMQRVHTNGTWLQKGAFHCWHTNAGVGLNTDSPLEAEPGLPGLSAVRAILPGDIANFTIHNWHWGSNPIESLRGVRDGNRQAPVRTHGLVNGGRVVLHILGNDFGAELRARQAMRLTRYSWDGTQYAAAEELDVRSGQVFFAPPAPDQIYVGRFM